MDNLYRTASNISGSTPRELRVRQRVILEYGAQIHDGVADPTIEPQQTRNAVVPAMITNAVNRMISRIVDVLDTGFWEALLVSQHSNLVRNRDP